MAGAFWSASTAWGITLSRTDVSLPAGSGADAVRVGNFDGVSGLDIVVPLRNTGEIGVLLSQGGGAFAPLRRFAACSFPVDVEVGDITAAGGGVVPDGKADIVVGCLQSPAVVVMPGDGAGGFGAPVPTGISRSDIFNLIAPEKADIVALANFRGGSGPPVVVTRSTPASGSGSALRGLCAHFDFRPGGGEVCSPTPYMMRGPIVPANINGAEFDEVLGWGSLNPLVAGQANLVTHGWQAPTFPLVPWSGPSLRQSGGPNIYAMASADLEPDGDLDVVMGRQLNVLNSPVDAVGIHKWEAGVGIPTTAPASVGTLPQLTSVAVANLDGDGKPDLAVAGGLRQVVVHPGNGDGSFGPLEPLTLPLPSTTLEFIPMTLEAGDVSGDGNPDLVALDATSSTVSVFRNLAPPVLVPPKDTVAPIAKLLKVLAPKGKIKVWRVSFTLNEPARVTAVLQRRNARGKFVSRKTVLSNRNAGVVRLSLGRPIPGSYRVRLTLRDAAGNKRLSIKPFVVPRP